MKSRRLLVFIKGLALSTFLLFTLGQLGRISFLQGRATLYLYEVPLVCLLAFLLFLYKMKPITFFIDQYKSVAVFFIVLSLTLLISLFRYSSTENLIAMLYFLRLLAYFVFFMYFFYFLKFERQLAQFFRIPLLLFLIFVLVSGFLQYFLYPDLRNLFYLGWDPHLYRVFGTFFEPVIAASIYGLLLIFIFFNRKFFTKNAFLQFVFMLPLFLLILLTYTRSAIFSLFILTAIYFFGRKKLSVFIVIFVLVLSLLILPKKAGEGVNLLRTSTISARVVDWEAGTQIAMKHIVFGIGYNHIGAEKKVTGPNNHAAAGFQSSFLIILVTSGVLGLISFLFMLYEMGRMEITTAYSVSYLAILSCFDNVFLHPFVLFLLFVLLSVANSVSRSER